MTPLSNKLKDIVDFFKADLKSYYSENELNAITVNVFESLLNINRQNMALYPEKRLNESQIVMLIKVIKRLKNYEPLQYIIGSTDFLDLKLNIKPLVFIPRPETEEFVLWIEQHLRTNRAKKSYLIDIGTGSGCIALSLKKRLPDFSVSGIDINPAAIALAKENARLSGLKVNFFEKDIFNFHSDEFFVKNQWDVIVSNPPYVKLSEKNIIDQNVLNYEPPDALFVEDNKPLIFYEAISDIAQKSFKDGGMLFFEINELMGEYVKDLLENKGFDDIEIKKDIHDKERFVKAKKAVVYN